MHHLDLIDIPTPGLWIAALLPVWLSVVIAAVFLTARFKPVEWCCVYENGVVYQQEHQTPVVIEWAEVIHIYRWDAVSRRNDSTGSSGVKWENVLIEASGRSIELPSGAGYLPFDESIYRRIADHVARSMVPRAATALDSGGAVEFGEIVLREEGPERQGRSLPWRDVAAIEPADNGSVRITERGHSGDWASESRFPNLAAFCVLSQRFL